jgi:hypothetical protein
MAPVASNPRPKTVAPEVRTGPHIVAKRSSIADSNDGESTGHVACLGSLEPFRF